VRTDLLDLRTWRWRSGAFLQRQPGGSAEDDECLLNMGVVLHEGQVMAIGGRHYWKVRCNTYINALCCFPLERQQMRKYTVQGGAVCQQQQQYTSYAGLGEALWDQVFEQQGAA
jgi:hypothetical protein